MHQPRRVSVAPKKSKRILRRRCSAAAMENATNALLRQQCAELLSARSPLRCPGSAPGPSQRWSAPAAAEPARAPKSSAHAPLHREDPGTRGAAAAAVKTYPTLPSTRRPLKSEAVGMTADVIDLTSDSSDNDADTPLDAATGGHGTGNASEVGLGSENDTMATLPVGDLPADLHGAARQAPSAP